MHGVGGIDPAAWGVEHAFGDHDRGAVTRLLARLEHEDHVTQQLAAVRRQQLGGAAEHRGVQVVPTGVHRPVDPRREVEAGLFPYRQPVHVGPQQDGGGVGGAPLGVGAP